MTTGSIGRRAAALGSTLLLTAAAGCASTPDAGSAQALAGCYYFDRDAAAESLRLPWGIRLTTDTVAGFPALLQRGDVWRATTLTGDAELDHPFGYWLATASDSVEVGYPAGGGLVLHLAVEEGYLRGTARPVGDLVRPGESAGARGSHRVALLHARCPED